MDDFEKCYPKSYACACALGKIFGTIIKYAIFWEIGKIILGL